MKSHPTLFWLIVFLTQLLRYLMVAGGAFLVYYVWKKKKLTPFKIQARFPKRGDYRREILYSLGTVVIFTAVGWLMMTPLYRAHSQLYRHWSDHGTAYHILSFFLLVLFHDTYFYWTHRAMHHPRLFSIFHLVHHKSTNPSPWAAYAFHPLEAVVEAGVVPLAALFIPLHHVTILVFLLFMIGYNVYGHLGWELYPTWVNRHWLGKWMNTSVNHNQHHQYFRGNYGLYFRFWDELMGTTRADYDQAFDRVTEKKEKAVERV